ncbi:MAG: cryptochrome/photolyase family protein [Myxococcales bacterium]|nr:cryptochrome/photolyase family protein [Myxococcales bacterium]
MNRLLVLLGNQLFPNELIEQTEPDVVFMAESDKICRQYRAHQHKLVLVLSSMRSKAEALREAGHEVVYTRLEDAGGESFSSMLSQHLSKQSYEEVACFETESPRMDQRLEAVCSAHGLKRALLPSPMFVTSREAFDRYRESHKRLFMADFYRWQRKRMDILLDDQGKPVGGRWSYADFSRFGEMLRIVPDLVRLRAYKSLYNLVSHYIEDDALRQVFSFQPLLIGGNPFRVPAIYLLIHWLERKWGIHFALGGTAAIVRGLTRLLEEVGVDLRLNAPVERIEVVNGRSKGVLLDDQTFLEADIIVSNADPAMVYTKLIHSSARRKHSDASVARRRYSMSLFVGYFGTKKTYPDVAHHSILLGPRYRELLTDIFDRKKLADDFSLYLHAPTRTDPSLVPSGGESFYVLSPVPNQESGIDWEIEGARYMDRILDALDRHHLPGLRDNLVTQFHVDPTYFETELRSYQGAAFGLEPTLRQSAYFRFHNMSEDIEGLYFVGAGVHPGAGLPGVLSSAKVLERVVPQRATEGRSVSVPEAVAV